MKKKAFLVLLALIMVLGQLHVMEEPVFAATKTEPWQDAYAKILKSPKEFYKVWGSEDESAYNKYLPYFYFSIRDIDNNGVPELIVRWDMGMAGHVCNVYTYSKGIKDLGYISLLGDFLVSENSKYPGLFYTAYAYYGDASHSYTTIKNNKLVDQVILEYKNEVLTKEDKKYVSEMEKAKVIQTYSITDSNINMAIYNYGITPHPYAIELSTYSENKNIVAYLEDINGDGVKEMLVGTTGSLSCDRLYYLHKGELCTYKMNGDLFAKMYFSTKKYLIADMIGGGHLVLKLKDGKVKEEVKLYGSINYDNTILYFKNDTKISKAEYEKLLKKYGISDADWEKLFSINSEGRVEYNRKNQFKEILTMTADVKVTSITLNKTSITLSKGKTYTLKATIKPKDATTKKVKWTTSNSKIATVDSKGKVKAISKGKVTIKATATDGSKVTKSCTVVVK
jgi:hypothetical protein